VYYTLCIKKATISFFQHSKLAKISQIIGEIKTGKNVALVTDAGTPGISDPGNKLVEEAVKNNIQIIPLPGPSGLTALASVVYFSGFSAAQKRARNFFQRSGQFKISGHLF
jgi:16S rRNA (cytidine1402-2'-O)-methyltransferase